MSVFIVGGSSNSFTNINTDGDIHVVGEKDLRFRDAVAKNFLFSHLTDAEIGNLTSLSSTENAEALRGILKQMLDQQRVGETAESVVAAAKPQLESRGVDVGKLLSTIGGAANLMAAIARLFG